MRIGIDLDNTIIRYDALFARLALERGLVPDHIAPHKQAIRDFLRSQGEEDRWTELQGIAYGSQIEHAVPFDGVIDFFRRCADAGFEWWIISHRSPFPYRGESVDLHEAARQWIIQRALLPADQLDRLILAVTRSAKLRAIAETKCEVFIDDLPELLTDPDFPSAVRRLLFDPANQNVDRPEYERVSSWQAITELLGLNEEASVDRNLANDGNRLRGWHAQSACDGRDCGDKFGTATPIASALGVPHLANLPDWFLPTVAGLLPQKTAVEDLRVVPVSGGGNNRVLRVVAGPNSFLAKWYFAAPEDPRDRWRTEWEFATFAWRRGLRTLPEPVACDPRRRLTLFEYVPGRRLAPAEVAAPQVHEAIEFLLDLNRHREHSEAHSLPAASEACFSFASHWQCIQQRVRRLQAAANDSVKSIEYSAAAQEFLDAQLRPTADRVIAQLRSKVRAEKWSEERELSFEQRIVSPSDFGFHNALLEASGRLRFLDFEYAGWDDPAKTVCDFFSQVAMPAPRHEWTPFAKALAAVGGDELPRRAELLRPLYRVKWCCIVLNPLLKTGRERQEFSRGYGPELAKVETDCLARAAQILSEIKD